MNIIYEFDPYEDADTLAIFQKAQVYYSCVHDITQRIRNFKKHIDSEDQPFAERFDNYIKLLQEIESDCEGLGIWDSSIN